MTKTTRKTIVASIAKRVGISHVKAKQGLETVLDAIKTALSQGRRVDLGRLGVLSVAARPLKHRIAKNLKHRGPGIDRVHQKHPKTVRLTKRHDLSENPQPTIVHRTAKPEIPAGRRLRVAVAFPRWRRRFR